MASGGTAQTTYTNGQLLIGNTTGNTLAKGTLTGTANQITVTNGGGSITLSTPQSIGINSTPTFQGVYLQTSGGTASLLNFYEEYSHTTVWGSLIWNLTKSGNLTITRVGKNICITFPAVSGATDGTFTDYIACGTVLPARFRPPSDVQYIVRVINSTVNQAGLLVFTASTGNIQFYASPDPTLFTQDGTNAGFLSTSVSYSV